MENAFFRYKLIIGESLRARSRAGQETEAILACNILNQMTQLGRPASYAIGVNGSVGRGRCGSVFEPRNNAPVRGDAAADLGAPGPGRLTRGECKDAGLAKRGPK